MVNGSSVVIAVKAHRRTSAYTRTGEVTTLAFFSICRCACGVGCLKCQCLGWTLVALFTASFLLFLVKYQWNGYLPSSNLLCIHNTFLFLQFCYSTHLLGLLLPKALLFFHLGAHPNFAIAPIAVFACYNAKLSLFIRIKGDFFHNKFRCQLGPCLNSYLPR